MILFRRSYIAAFHDVVMAALSILFSLYLRLGDQFFNSFDVAIPACLLFMAVCACVFSFMQLYRGIWRYASLKDLVQITKAVSISIFVFLALMFIVNRLDGIPRSLLVINWFVLLAFLGGPRFLYRVVKDKIYASEYRLANDNRIPVLLVGLCANAELFIRECQRNRDFDYKVVAIIDNDPQNVGRQIHGVKVRSTISTLPRMVRQLKKEGNAPRRLIITHDHMDGAVVRDLLKTSQKMGLSIAKLPRLSDFKVDVERIEVKPIAIEDLLGRSPTIPHIGKRKNLIEGKTVLITGAGGSIGSELTRQIAAFSPKKIILMDISEYNLYRIDSDCSREFSDISKRAVIGDVRNYNFLANLFKEENPDIVFHAAALKHVPIVENNLSEAILTNVIGTRHVADLCLEYKVAKMVLISTDKAVNPSSLMGVTKRIAEQYVQSIGASDGIVTDFITVRFGNVLGSSGSVIPLFQKQLEEGGPITITDFKMERFFMTISEAVELVLLAATLPVDVENKHSGIFVLNMGEPVKIYDLAKQMVTLAGLRPDIDVKIRETGMREGEKLYEELFYKDETPIKTSIGDIILAHANVIDFELIKRNIHTLESLALKQNEEELIVNLITIVPEYQSNKSETKVYATSY